VSAAVLPGGWRGLETAVVELARLYGWRVAHFRPARTAKGWRTPVEGHAGFPDMVLARSGRPGSGPRVLFVELKSGRGRLGVEQKLWIETLAQVPCVEVVVWTPDDLMDGRVQECLR
jgi:hypothetical protein